METTNSTQRSWAVVPVNDYESDTRHLYPEDFTDLAAGRLGIFARPGTRRLSWVTSDLLAALGRDPHVLGAGRAGEGRMEHVQAWTLAYGVTDVLVQNAWLLPYSVLAELMEAADDAQWTLWLVGDTGYTDRHRETVGDFHRQHDRPEPDELDGAAFVARWAGAFDRAPEARCSTHVVGWPRRLPTDDFPTFRSACRDLLSTEEFELVDGHFRAEVMAVADVAANLPSGTVERERAVADWLHARWEQTATWQQFQTTVRAVQVALFKHRVFLDVSLDRLIGTATGRPQQALADPALWTALRAYAAPERAATCALTAARLTVRQIAELTLSDVAADGSTVTCDGSMFEVLEPAREFVRAQRFLRLIETDGTVSGPFIASDDKKVREATLARYVTDARRELGVAVTVGQQWRDVEGGDRWLQRWGLKLQDLT